MLRKIPYRRKALQCSIAFVSAIFCVQVEAKSDFSDAQLCIAGIATNNGRSAKIISLMKEQGDEITVGYTRDYDGKAFQYTCKIEGNQIRWHDQSMPEWNKNIKIYYSLVNNGKQLDIKVIALGNETNKSFNSSDF